MKLLKSKSKLIFLCIGILLVLIIVGLVLHQKSKNSHSQQPYKSATVSDLKAFVSSSQLPPESAIVKRKEIKGDGYTVAAAQTGNIDSPVSFEVGGAKVSFTSVGNSNLGKMNPSDLTTDENGKITYKNIYNGINLIYTPEKDKILEEYEVVGKRKVEYLVQKIDMQGLKYEKQKDGSIIFTNSSTNQFAFAVPRPVMYEKYNTKERNFGLHYEIFEYNGNTYLAKVIDEEGAKWIESRANYPVMIDATILLTLFSYTSYPTVENIWQIDTQTVGSGDLTIRPGEGTSWNLENQPDSTKDLSNLTLTCNGKNIDYQKNSDGSVLFKNFSCDENIVVKTKVSDPTKQNNLDFNYSGFTSSVSSIVETEKPLVISSSVSPSVVKVGDTLTLTVELSDKNGISSVSADMGGVETIPLSLKEGKSTHGTWQAEWKVHNTATKPYEVKISAANIKNEITLATVGFFDPYTCLGGGDHAGADWNPVTDGCASNEIAGNHTNIGIFSVNNGQTVSVKTFDQVNQYGIATVSASTVTIAGTLTADSKGWAGALAGFSTGSGPGAGGAGQYPGGAGHGGTGAAGTTGAGGGVYGSLSIPGEFGSGGGSGNNGGLGGYGGGVIQITATGTLTNSGTIKANGGGAVADQGGGGAGGSIYISAGTITGNGAITANGGNSSTGAAGGGGGGRIAVYYYVSNSYSGTVTVTHGSNGVTTAQEGTAFIRSYTGDLLIPTNNSTWNGSDFTNWTFRDLTINANVTFLSTGANLLTITATRSSSLASSITVSAGGSYTNNSNGVGVYFNLSGDVSIPSGTTISANGLGYAGGASNANAAGDGTGGGGAGTAGYPGGGGYGGAGSSGTVGSGGSTYGSLSAPVDLGSGGGSANSGQGGAGGGAIKLTTDGTLTITGSITANGSAYGADRGGGGGGGSVYISAGSLSGNGSITANGGNASTGAAGAGGGGRIAVYYTVANNFTGTVSQSPGGNTALTPENGTSFIKASSVGSLLIPSSNGKWYYSDLPSWTFRDLTINGNVTFLSTGANLLTITATGSSTFATGITVSAGGSYTNNSNGVGVYFNLSGDVTIPSTTIISANALGYSGGASNANAAGDGSGGGGAGAAAYPGGGGYGGTGGSGTVGAAGSTYGSSTIPVDLGSGGGSATSGQGGPGGGAIKLTTDGTLTVSGSIKANGSAALHDRGGGGSGGSIYISVGTITGSGSITANGGNSSTGAAGGGGGGRIAVYCTNGGAWVGSALASATTATAGSNGIVAPNNGTVYSSCLVVNSKVNGNVRFNGNARIK